MDSGLLEPQEQPASQLQESAPRLDEAESPLRLQAGQVRNSN